jgi:hypothetical protein
MCAFPETECGIDPEPPVVGQLIANQLKFGKFISGQLV